MTVLSKEVLGLRVEVMRSERRTAALYIFDSVLQIRVPYRLGDERIAVILKQKRPWIRSKVADLKRLSFHRTKEMVSGESFLYLGRNYRLKVSDGHQVGVCLSGGYLRATIRPTEQGQKRKIRIHQYLQKWYRSRALERLSEKAKRYAQQIGVAPTAISVRNFKSRWGSCNKKGHLTFNWNIIKAPHTISDYVVIHELCHLIHLNHSKEFWALVNRYDHSYVNHRKWLKQNGLYLLNY